MKKPIRVMLVDDHPVVLEGIKNSLSKRRHLKIVAEVTDGSTVVEAARATNPDVIILDIQMPKVNGIQAMKLLRKHDVPARVIGFSMHESREYMLEMLRLGARGYVLKEIAPDELVDAIERVFKGEAAFPPSLGADLLNMVVRNNGSINLRDGSSNLSNREQEILIMIAEGSTSRVIADRLSIGLRTVETHRERIMKKLNIRNTSGLTRYAISRGWVEARL